MKIKNLFTVLLLALFVFTSTVLSQVDKEQTFEVKKGETIKVDINYGNIKYYTGSGDKLEVKAYNILPEEVKYLSMEKSGNTVLVKFRGEDSDDFRVKITGPEEFNLDFETGGGNVRIEDDVKGKVTISTGGGNVSTENVFGKLNISTAGGNIKVGNVSGDLKVRTAGGDIKTGDVNGKAKISTAGGNIKAGSINGSAKISTAGGNIFIEKTGGDTKISTAGGNIKVTYVSGNTELNTAGGNIKIEGADGNVEVNTGAGNIKLTNIKGSVSANTAAGNIYAELFPGRQSNSKLNTAIGNITLKIPSNADATITARVRVMMWGYDEDDMDQITSDFEPESIRKNKEKKQIEAVYKLNGGKSKIDLNVGMGEINIEKAD